MTTPKMTAMTPNSFGASLGFSPALLGHSPAAAASQLLMAKHRSPAASGSTTQVANFNSPGMLSALGLGTSAAGTAANMGIPQLPPDENKKRELGEILKLLASRPGRISGEAVERLAKGMGLECYKETAPSGIVTLSIAARIFLIDIDFAGDTVERVALSFEKTSGPSAELAHLAAAIFQKNLSARPLDPSAPEKVPLLTPSLVDFADNLNRLASVDRLSTPSMNCFAAITGLYQSLLKIHEYEKRHMDGGEVAAMCGGIGRPRMHARGKVGLSVDYWQARRLVPRAAKPKADTEEADGEEQEPRIWRIIIEVEEATPEFSSMSAISPVRTSDHWVTDEIKKPREDNLFGDVEEADTDWLEPPIEEVMDDDLSQSRPPSARFVARLDPPVFLPFQNEMDIYQSLMATPPAVPELSTMERILFPTLPSNGLSDRSISLPPSSRARDLDEDGDHAAHRYRLNATLKPVVGRYVSEIPFSHPKELPGYFSLLRQFALLATLLESCFSAPFIDAARAAEARRSAAANDGDDDDDEMEIDSLDAFLGGSPADASVSTTMSTTAAAAGEGDQRVMVDVSILPELAFGVGVVFPREMGLVNVLVQVGRNAELRAECADDNVKGKAKVTDPKGVERALRVSEDLGLVVEWIRRSGR